MFSIRDYEGFEFAVDYFDLQGFEAVGFDSDSYFERFLLFDMLAESNFKN